MNETILLNEETIQQQNHNKDFDLTEQHEVIRAGRTRERRPSFTYKDGCATL